MTSLDPRLVATVLVAAPSREGDLDAALERIAEAPLLDLDPTAAWLLVALARHLSRQRWVGEVVRTLGGDLAAIGTIGALGHPEERARSGDVPGLDGWSYRFHGRGCRMTHRDGTELDVDFHGGACELIDPFFFQSYLRSAHEPSLAELRLRRTEPIDEHWMAAVPTLRAAGLIEGDHALRVTQDGLVFAATLEVFVDPIAEPAEPVWRKAYLAAALGDWELARERMEAHAHPSATLVRLAERARQQRGEATQRRLGEDAAEQSDRAKLLQALAALGRDVAETSVLAALQRTRPDRATSAALAIVAWWSDPRHEPAVMALLDRCGSAEPHLRQRAIELILKQHTPDAMPLEIRERLLAATAHDGHAHEGAISFLEHALVPSLGLTRLVRALDHDVPNARTEAAAGLALIGTEQARLALQHHGGPDARAALAVLEGRADTAGELDAEEPEAWTAFAIEHARAQWGEILRRWLRVR